MNLIRNHLTEYLIYLLSLAFFAGKTYQIVTALVIVSFFVDVIRFKRIVTGKQIGRAHV